MGVCRILGGEEGLMSGTIRLPEPLPHQEPIFDSPARFKVRRAGRRTGKTREIFIAAMGGHGPGWRTQRPMFPGVLQGWDVVWVALDYPQAKAIWNEEIRVRFEGHDGVELNKTDRTATFAGAGTLHVRSSEAIDGIRGLGKDLKGVVFDEGAHYDLLYCWRDVVRPILADNAGWAMFDSTTNAGLDGNDEQVAPSYFNRLCEEIQGGQRTPEDGWAEFYGTAEDNPLISPAEFAALVKEYPVGSVSLDQEVYARLLAAGAGLAFPEWDQRLHTFNFEIPRGAGWRWFAGMDWGYTSPGCFSLFAAGPDGEILLRWEHYFKERTPYDVGQTIGEALLHTPELEFPEWVALDASAFYTDNGSVSNAEEIDRGFKDALRKTGIRVPIQEAPAGPRSRVTRKLAMHEALKVDHERVQPFLERGELVPRWAAPRFRIHTSCVNHIRTIPALPRDARDPEKVETHGVEDHALDSCSYALVSRTPEVQRKWLRLEQDRHPGFDAEGQRRRRPRGLLDELAREAEAEREWAGTQEMLETGRGLRTGYRWVRHDNEEGE